MSSIIHALDNPAERRAPHRLPVVVPASICVGNLSFTAKMTNIVHDGAMLETNAPVMPNRRIKVRCGTVNADAEVMWREGGRTV